MTRNGSDEWAEAAPHGGELIEGDLRSLVDRTDDGGRRRALVLVATNEAEDTAAVALALARVVGADGTPVLIVDANPVLPLTQRIRPTPRYGLSDVLRGFVTLDDALVRIRTSKGALPVLASGHPLPRHVGIAAADLEGKIVARAPSATVVIVDCGTPDPERLSFAGGEGATVAVVGNGPDGGLTERLRQAGAQVRGRILVEAAASSAPEGSALTGR